MFREFNERQAPLKVMPDWFDTTNQQEKYSEREHDDEEHTTSSDNEENDHWSNSSYS